MSIQDLMKNVYTFANILCQAGNETVINWDERSIEKAFNWAKYCQQIYTEVKGKPYEEELNSHIKGLVIHLQPVACFQEFDLKTLGNSAHKLHQILLQNPYLSSSLYEHLLNKKFCVGGVDDADKDVVENIIEICQKSSKNLAAIRLLEDVIDNSKLIDPVPSITTQAQSNLLLKSLVDKIHLTSETRFVKYVNSLLSRLFTTKEGTYVILRLLVPEEDVDYTVKQIEDINTIQQIILNFLQENMSEDMLLSMDEELLIQISASHQIMFKMHLQCLIKIVAEMQIHYGVSEHSSLYTWRFKENHQGWKPSYSDVLQTFQRLYRLNNQSKVFLLDNLHTLSQNSYVNVYRDILKYLEKS